MTNTEITELKPRIFGSVITAGILLGIFASTASAATFGVRVVDAAGMPVQGASVCFGLHGNYRQFAALFTDSQGQATAEVPNVPVVVTISKTRFSGTRVSEPARGFNLIKQVTLVEGAPGPRCKAGSTLAENEPSHVKIENVDVHKAGNSVQLTPEASGDPTDYRLGVSPEFDLNQIAWQPLDITVDVPDSLVSEDVVYLQLRRYLGTQNGWVESISRVAPVRLPGQDES